MNDVRTADSWWPSSQVRGVALVLRILIPTSTMVALMCTSLAAGRTVLIVDAAIFGIALVCTVRPDSHVGLLVVLAVGGDWLATVHDRATPWSVLAAASLAVFHASMAAASVAPPAARWTRAMCRRWTRRSFAVMVASLGTWAVVAAVHGRHIASSAILIAASLIIIAIAGLWARGGTLDAEPGA